MAQDTWKVGISRPAIFSFDNPLELILYAKDLDTLRGTAKVYETGMAGFESIKDVQNSMRAGYPEIQIEYDRELLRQYNLSTQTAAQMVKSKVQGQKASSLSFGDERIDLTVRLMEQDRQNISKLKNININPTINPAIPLSSVATFSETEGPSEIRRIDQQRAAVFPPTWMALTCPDATLTSRLIGRVGRFCPVGVCWPIQRDGRVIDLHAVCAWTRHLLGVCHHGICV